MNCGLQGTVRAVVLLAVACLGTVNLAYGQANPGDPLYCSPNEGVAFLIVNGGSGVFTASQQCYNDNIALDTDTTITTSQGGTLTRTAGTGNYIYTPPTPNFTGLDTFPIRVLTVWNAVGGPGSAGGTSAPGGPLTLTITLNVIPATTYLNVSGATTVPVPAGSITGCSAPGAGLSGAAAGTTYGCIAGIIPDGLAPSHGTITQVGNTIVYTPNGTFTGTDTFKYYALGVDNLSVTGLNSGAVTVVIPVPPPAPTAVPTLGVWGLLILTGALLLFGMRGVTRRTV